MLSTNMARNTSAALPPFFLLVVVACLSSGAWASYYYYDFSNSLQVWNSTRGSWRWTNVQNLDTVLPAGPDGFAVMDSPSASDELYTPWFTAPNGGKLAIKFYLRSEYVGSNDLTIKIYTDKNTRPVLLLDLEKYSQPDTKEWFVEFAEMAPQSTRIRLDIFCFNGKRAKPGEPLMGCAIDTLAFESYEDPTTSTITPTTLPPTAPPTTLLPTYPTTTYPPTTYPPTTYPPTTYPPTTYPPTTEPPTTEPPTTEPPTTKPPTTEPPTTEPPTTEPPTTEPPTTEPPTTEPPTTEPPTTEPPTTEPPTTEPPTTEPPTTEPPTTEPLTTEPPTTEPPTTEPPTTEPPTTEPPTTEPSTTEPPTTEPPTTEPLTTYPPTTEPPTTEPPTTYPPTTYPPTTYPPTTYPPTTNPPTTNPPTTNPPTTNPPTTNSPTTEAPSGPLVFDFQDDTNGWSLVQMNNAAFSRVRFQSSLVDAPPAGPWVLQVFQDNIQSGTVVATSPVLEAVDTEMKISLIFWMDGTVHYPAQLKIRRRFTFSSFEETPVMNLDPFGNQINQLWLTYNVTLTGLTLGQTFSLILEASQGGDPTNAVVINRLEVSGVRVIESDFTIMNFENGLMGWSIGNMDGGLWQLVNWTTLNPSLKVPRPATGDMFLISSRNHIYSGVLSIESPLLPASGGTTKRLKFKFWVRGSVTYPAVLSIRKKTPDGRYDTLPFVNLRSYGNIDSQSWLNFQRDVIIPLEEGDFYYQLVIEVDLGGRNENLVGIDDLTITTV
nr:uncharacterized protein LOC123756828 [Procambarus clarkii]